MSTIDIFKARLVTGGARPTLFRVRLSFPGIVGAGMSPIISGELLCKATSLPASNITPIEVRYRGRPVKVAGDREFDNWTIQIINENDFELRDTFESWMDKINSHSLATGISAPALYTADMTVDQLDKSMLPVKTYKYVNCFPINVGQIELSYDAANQIEEFPVTFALDRWDSNSTT